MKNKIIYSGTMLVIVCLAVMGHIIDFESGISRVHQHRVAPQAAQSDQEVFTTHLPIVMLNTNDQRIPGSPIIENDKKVGYETGPNGEEEVTIGFKLIDNNDGHNQLEDPVQVETLANVRYRGNSSRYFHKKSLAVELVDEAGKADPRELAGMSTHNEWVLNGPFLDRTLIRNYMCLNIAGEIMEYAPNVRFCELFLDGEYQGVYLIMETITRSPGRINISKPENTRDRTSYIVRWDRRGKGDRELDNFLNYTLKSDISALDVRYPGTKLITPGRMDYIQQDISRIEKSLYSYDLLGEQYDYKQYIDIRAFAQYFIINEFFGNVDAGRFSTFYYKDLRGKVKPCVWDFNNACDNNYVDYVWRDIGFTMINAPWFSMLIKDEAFVDQVVHQYRLLRKGVLSEEYLMNYIDETIAYLGDAVARNYDVWGYVFDLENAYGLSYLLPRERNHTSYESAVEQLRSYIKERGRWLDEHIETLYQYSHPSKNTNRVVE